MARIVASALLWACGVGLVGFVGGFVGPLLLNPSGNQGPLLGLLITGPGGFLLGLLFGFARGVRAYLRRGAARSSGGEPGW